MSLPVFVRGGFGTVQLRHGDPHFMQFADSGLTIFNDLREAKRRLGAAGVGEFEFIENVGGQRPTVRVVHVRRNPASSAFGSGLALGAGVAVGSTAANRLLKRRKNATTAAAAAASIPSELATIGTLESVKYQSSGGRMRTWRAPRGRIAYLCTDASGKDLYVAFASRSTRFRPLSRSRNADSGAAKMTKRFHGISRPTHQLQLEMDTEIPSELRRLGEVKEILYKPLEPSPKAQSYWSHEAGDLGPGKADTVTLLCTRLDGSGLFFVVQQRDRGYPRVTERGIVG